MFSFIFLEIVQEFLGDEPQHKEKRHVLSRNFLRISSLFCDLIGGGMDDVGGLFGAPASSNHRIFQCFEFSPTLTFFIFLSSDRVSSLTFTDCQSWVKEERKSQRRSHPMALHHHHHHLHRLRGPRERRSSLDYLSKSYASGL